ncbi:MAG: efflux RND transporter permease subunit [Gammaproteobacteria bacterium]|nr:efflux RND transporter permease subunit [Gammaproteobacteria bacterium]
MLARAGRRRRCAGIRSSTTSFVYVIFEDGTDMYWARSRVLERSAHRCSRRCRMGSSPELGPDATGVGWVYQYALVDRTGRHDLGELRSLQDWFLKYELQTVKGVSEVASIGGMVTPVPGRRRSGQAARLRPSADAASRDAIQRWQHGSAVAA